MNIKTLVDRGLQLRALADGIKVELEEIEQQIIDIAQQGEQIPLVDEEREGKQYLAVGTAATIPVIFTADKIIASFKDRSAVHGKIVLAAGEHLEAFYKSQTTWEMIQRNGKIFRRQAGEILGAAGPAFITACLARDKFGIPKSDIKIDWSRPKCNVAGTAPDYDEFE